MGVGVKVGEGVAVGVGLLVGVAVGVRVGVAVAVAGGVAVGRGVLEGEEASVFVSSTAGVFSGLVGGVSGRGCPKDPDSGVKELGLGVKVAVAPSSISGVVSPAAGVGLVVVSKATTVGSVSVVPPAGCPSNGTPAKKKPNASNKEANA